MKWPAFENHPLRACGRYVIAEPVNLPFLSVREPADAFLQRVAVKQRAVRGGIAPGWRNIRCCSRRFQRILPRP